MSIGAIYAFDLRRVEAENDRLISDSADGLQLLRLVSAALDVIGAIPVHREVHDPHELVLSRLMIRLLNGSIGALHLARGGLYQQSAALLRDVMEVTFLLDLFASDANELELWIALTPKKREEHFKPWKVRKKLDDRDGFKERKRDAAYKLLSSYAAHPTPEGFSVISPENMTQLGPFPSALHFKALLEEAAMRVTDAALKCLKHAGEPRSDLTAKKATFLSHVDWLLKRATAGSVPPPTPPP